MWRCLFGLAVCVAHVACVHAAMNPDVGKIAGVYWAGEPKGPVKRVVVEKRRFAFPSGVPVPGVRFKVVEEEYDRDGRLERRTRYHGEEQQAGFQTNEYVYDSVGRLVEDAYSTETFPRAYVMRNMYDERGYRAETVYVDSQNEPTSRRLYDYDERGRCTSERYIQRDGTELQTTRYSYADDEADKPSETTYYDRDARLLSRGTYEYTAQGDIAVCTMLSAQGFVQAKTTNTYDANGKLVQETQESPQGKNVVCYDRHANPINEVMLDADGHLLVRSVRLYAYDRYGNWTHCYDFRTTRILCGFRIMTPHEFTVKRLECYEGEKAGPETKESQ